jgi:hypothetical protein
MIFYPFDYMTIRNLFITYNKLYIITKKRQIISHYKWIQIIDFIVNQ